MLSESLSKGWGCLPGHRWRSVPPGLRERADRGQLGWGREPGPWPPSIKINSLDKVCGVRTQTTQEEERQENSGGRARHRHTT